MASLIFCENWNKGVIKNKIRKKYNFINYCLEPLPLEPTEDEDELRDELPIVGGPEDLE